MHIVEEQEFCEKAYPSFTNIFNLTVDKRHHFSEFISSRIIVYDTFSDSIDDAVPMKIIITAAKAVGDKGCYFYLPYPNLLEPDFYYVPLDELEEAYYFNYDDYPDKKIREEIAKKIAEWTYRYPIFGGRGCTIIYSENGQWGIKTSMCSSWGLLGGTNDFVSKLKRDFSDIERQIFSFLFAFHVACESDGTNFYTQIEGIIKSDLEHVYGMEQASKIIVMTPKELLERSGRDILDFINPDFINKYTELM
jgi:hypothetical protein